MAGKKKIFPSYAEAEKIARTLGITSREDYYKSNALSYGLPSHPQMVYRNIGWESWMKYLGYKRTHTSPLRKRYMSMHKAMEIVQPLHLMSSTEYIAWHKKTQPKDIPLTPTDAYKETWKGWWYFIGCPCSRPDYGKNMHGNQKERDTTMRKELLAIMQELLDPNLSLERFNVLHTQIKEMK